eukprot:TRINITY_DN81671_c0_g1_i1.p1 TRINITY_DN81671_c0_g1~~TRINITY_DN81671_c0_g1_i1.p1  ORF type:complete len:458 (+),score=94.12 TRINITY_DN81671_c0_g1_i1:134-1507(+)
MSRMAITRGSRHLRAMRHYARYALAFAVAAVVCYLPRQHWAAAVHAPPLAPNEPPLAARPWRELAGGGNKKAWRPFPKKQPEPGQAQQSKLLHVDDIEELVDEIRNSNLTLWEPMNIATAWQRLAKHTIGQKSSADVQKCCKRLADELKGRELDQFKPREVSSIIYSCGVLGYTKGEVVKRLSAYITKRLDRFDSQGIANTIYAFQKIGYQHEKFLTAVAELMTDEERLDDFEPQELANVVMSMGRLDFRHRDCLLAICNVAKDRLSEFKAQELANLLYGLGILKFRHRGLLMAMAEQIPDRLWEFNAQNVANTVRAIDILGFKNYGLTAALTKHIADHTHEIRMHTRMEPLMQDLMSIQASLTEKSKGRRDEPRSVRDAMPDGLNWRRDRPARARQAPAEEEERKVRGISPHLHIRPSRYPVREREERRAPPGESRGDRFQPPGGDRFQRPDRGRR